MKKFIALLLCLVLCMAAGCTKATQPTDADANAAPTVTDEPTTTEEPTMNQNPIATITMADGSVMKIELYPDVAPNTVKNFISLANSGFYDGLKFHRIYAGFMIQGGDPNGDGTGDPGYSIKGEFSVNGVKNTLSHTRGVISMARAQPYDSAGSQFFIMHGDAPSLDGSYAAFGMLIEGFDTLDAIAATPCTTNAWGEKSVPTYDVVIQSITVDTFGVTYGEPEIIQ